MKPEGVVVYHSALNKSFKITCEKDESPKGLVAMTKEEEEELRAYIKGWNLT